MPEFDPAALASGQPRPDPALAGHRKMARACRSRLEAMDQKHAKARAALVAEIEHHERIAGKA